MIPSTTTYPTYTTYTNSAPEDTWQRGPVVYVVYVVHVPRESWGERKALTPRDFWRVLKAAAALPSEARRTGGNRMGDTPGGAAWKELPEPLPIRRSTADESVIANAAGRTAPFRA